MAFQKKSAFAAAFPEPVRDGSLVIIEGRAKPSSAKFVLKLLCMPSEDKALICSFHLHDQVVVRNHLADTWGDEEISGGWPIDESEEFEIEFRITEDKIRIYVDGKYFRYFKHRLPYSSITHINGSVGANYTSIRFDRIEPTCDD